MNTVIRNLLKVIVLWNLKCPAQARAMDAWSHGWGIIWSLGGPWEVELPCLSSQALAVTFKVSVLPDVRILHHTFYIFPSMLNGNPEILEILPFFCCSSSIFCPSEERSDRCRLHLSHGCLYIRYRSAIICALHFPTHITPVSNPVPSTQGRNHEWELLIGHSYQEFSHRLYLVNVFQVSFSCPATSMPKGIWIDLIPRKNNHLEAGVC